MKTIPLPLLSHLAGEALTVAVCVKVARADGVVMGFTTHDSDLVVSGVTYEALSSVQASAIRQVVNTGVDNLEIVGLLQSDRIAETDILAGRYDGADVVIFVLNWASPGDGVVTLLGGTVGDFRARDGQWITELRSRTQRLSQQIGDLTSPTCRVSQFGSAECGVAGGVAAFQFARTLASAAATTAAITGAQIVAINAGGGAAAPFAADSSYSGGQTLSVVGTIAIDTSPVTNPAPATVYRSYRYVKNTGKTDSTDDTGNFTYTLGGLGAGQTFTLRLHFCETYYGAGGQRQRDGHSDYGGAGSRVFDVLVQGVRVLADLDVFTRAGGTNVAHVEEITATADASGNIAVLFEDRTDNAIICGLEVVGLDVAAITSGISFSGDTKTTGYYSYGLVAFTSGANAGISREIRQHVQASGTAVLRLAEAFPFALAVGDAAILTAGCDRRFETCRYSFANGVNFRGEPNLPGNDKIIGVGRGLGNVG